MKVVNVILGVMLLLGIVLVPAGSVSAMSLSLTACMQVQNLDSATASGEMKFYSQTAGETPISVPISIDGNSSTTFCNIGSLPAGFNGSAVISSTAPLAVIANLQTPDFKGLMATYRGVDSGFTSVNIPLVKKNDWGYSTQFTVQNAGAATTNVAVTYSDGVVVNKAIEAGRSFTFDQSLEAHVDPFPASNAGWIGAATITSNPEPIVVVNLESNGTVLFAYNGFATSDASTAPIFPLIQANWYTYFTGVALQNTSTTTDSTITMSFTPTTAGTACTQTILVPKNSMKPFAVNAWATSDTNTDNNCVNGEGFVGYAKVTANTGNVPLVGIVNELSNTAGKGGSYDGFNPTKGTNTVLFPLITDHNYGFFTGFALMNVGDTAIDITCSYTGTSKTQSKANLAVGSAWTTEQLNFFFADFPSGYVGSGTCVATKTAGSGGGTSVKIQGVLNYLKNGTTTDTFLVSEGMNK